MITNTEKSIIEAISIIKILLDDLLFREDKLVPFALIASSLPPDEQRQISDSLQSSQDELKQLQSVLTTLRNAANLH